MGTTGSTNAGSNVGSFSIGGGELVYNLRPLMPAPDANRIKIGELGRTAEKSSASVIDAIKRRGVLRVAIVAYRLPYVFLNREGNLVGFDIEMAHLLGRDLGVRVELVELDNPLALPSLLASGRVDISMAGIAVTPERASEMLFSEPYLNETLAFVVKDYLRDEFSSWASIRDLGAMPVKIPNLPYYIDQIKRRAPELKLEVPESMNEIEAGMKQETFDAIVLPAESGSVLTLLHPQYAVVVPEPETVKIPLAYPLARRDQNWAHFINTWIELKRREGTIAALYDHWILGKHVVERRSRWSIMRNVLRWVE